MNHIEASHPLRVVRLLASLAIGVALLFFTAVPRARADDKNEECRHRIARADHRLHEAIEHHGAQSAEADQARHELHEARERCWNENHKWWDEDQHRWRDQQDWDDHDHDRDYPHDR